MPTLPATSGMSGVIRMKWLQKPPAPVGTAARMRGSTAPTRLVYCPPIDWPCAKTCARVELERGLARRQRRRRCTRASVAGIDARACASASRNRRCSITPWRNVSRNAARLLKLRYAVSPALGQALGVDRQRARRPSRSRTARARTPGPRPWCCSPSCPSTRRACRSGHLRRVGLRRRQVPRSTTARAERRPSRGSRSPAGSRAAGISPLGSVIVDRRVLVALLRRQAAVGEVEEPVGVERRRALLELRIASPCRRARSSDRGSAPSSGSTCEIVDGDRVLRERASSRDRRVSATTSPVVNTVAAATSAASIPALRERGPERR